MMLAEITGSVFCEIAALLVLASGLGLLISELTLQIAQLAYESHPRHREIKTEVEQVEAELLVVGTHGRTGVARALLGSVAEDLLSDPPCDTAAVRAW